MIIAVTFTGTLQAQRHGRDNRYYSSRHYPTGGQRFYSLPGAFLQLSFGGNPYYYSSGLFYRPYSGYYQVSAPPFGIHINILPRGYMPLRWGSNAYYYFNGIFYQRNNSYNDYEVVQAPVGAEIPSIPRDARTMVIDGEKYFELNDSYFKEFIKPNGEIWYKVSGKHGVLNTEKENNSATYTQPPVTNNSNPAIGEVMDKLPNDCKVIVINSKKYYVSADNIYYEELIDGNQLRYKVAGK